MADENKDKKTQKKPTGAWLGQAVTALILGILLIIGLWTFGGGKHHRGDSFPPTGDLPTPNVSGSPQVEVPSARIIRMDNIPVKQTLEVNTGSLVGHDVNAYAGGGRYIHWMLTDSGATMEVYANGQYVGREAARMDPGWAPLRFTTEVSRVDFRLIPGIGSTKSKGHVVVWYDDSPTDEYAKK